MLDQRTSKTPVPPADILTELEPALQQGLERHLSQATEWFPHEYVPYEEGRNYVAEPWEPTDSRLSEIARIIARGQPADRGQPALLPPRALGDVRQGRGVG